MHIAIAGCGQLSRMLALAGIPMGLHFSFIADADEDSRCVRHLGEVVRWQPGMSVEQLYTMLGRPDRITAEKEQVDVNWLSALEKYCVVHPNAKAFAVCQDRYSEKQLLDKLEIPCAAYSYAQPADVDIADITLPVVVKSCREGYDGKNQWVLKTRQDLESFRGQANEEHYIFEQFVPFQKEISQVSVRDEHGSICHYPLTENQHERGMLKQSLAPAVAISKRLCSVAQDNISRIMGALNYVGVMAMECFVVDDQLLVNELAPRVHNSGHWTQAGSDTCQFENHLRAVCGLAPGSTELRGAAGMINLIGIEKPPLASMMPTSKLHWYDKQVRVGRKLGHINFIGDTVEDVAQSMQSVASAYGLAPVR